MSAPGAPISMTLTPEEVLAEVASIERKKRDYEAAHGAEDALHRIVLQQIAEMDAGLASRLAEAALKTRDIDFARHAA